MASNALVTKSLLSKSSLAFKSARNECAVTIQAFSFSTSEKNQKDALKPLSSYRRGTGGRSSFSGKVATVFGATGVVGRILVNRLGKMGTQIIVPNRSDEHAARPLKLCGDLGQILFYPFDLANDDLIRNAVKNSDLVINCIGRDWETKNWSFEQVNLEGARKIAKISKECGVEKLIHFSALNASPNPQSFYSKNGSKFLRTKYEGELAVRSEFPNAVIIRPSAIYGEQDRFLYFYTSNIRRLFGMVPMWNKGEKTIKIPVHQRDVANGVMKIVNDPEIFGKTFDFVGENRYLLSDLVDFIMASLRRDNVKRTYMSPIYLATTYLCEKFPRRRYFNFDYLEREFVTDVITPENGQLKDLGIEFVKLEEMIPWHLKAFNRYAYYDEKLGEFADPQPPNPLPENYEATHRF